jgi:hypothetical protein
MVYTINKKRKKALEKIPGPSFSFSCQPPLGRRFLDQQYNQIVHVRTGRARNDQISTAFEGFVGIIIRQQTLHIRVASSHAS